MGRIEYGSVSSKYTEPSKGAYFATKKKRKELRRDCLNKFSYVPVLSISFLFSLALFVAQAEKRGRRGAWTDAWMKLIRKGLGG